jgi:tetratricopeptide (TPR) repeat protein
VLQFPGETEGELTFSRVVRATVGQLVEIPFRGTGWVFLGELEARRGIAYGSRRLDPEGQSFIFRAEEAGAYALKFYKQDFIRDYILNDYVRVIVGEAPEPQGIAQFTPPIDRGRVIAEPRWPLPPEAASGPGGTPLSAGKPPAESSPPTEPAPTPVTIPGRGSAPISTPPPSAPVSAGTSPTPEQEPELTPAAGLPVPKQEPESSPAVGDASGPLPPEGYTNRAREEYDAGRIAPALSILDQFREIYPAGSDEAWWLYGQLLEANSPSRDIRSALDYYRRLVREYPQSPRIDEARRRIAYLERYYFNIH